MKKIIFTLYAVFLLAAVAHAQFDDPFSVLAEVEKSAPDQLILNLFFSVPEDHYLYADAMDVSSSHEDVQIRPLQEPETVAIEDQFLDQVVPVYKSDVHLTYELSDWQRELLEINVAYQGCSSTFCFMPMTQSFQINTATAAIDEPLPASDESAVTEAQDTEMQPAETWEHWAEKFSLRGHAVGYLPAADFINFIGRAEAGAEVTENALEKFLLERGLLLTILLILFGGLALNLTPCVLPMIPVNIAIIGAGAQASSRRRGFTLGAVYGLGIAFVYGLLGLFAVLFGARFGTLNSSPWFNLGIGILFILLALAMFGIFNLDFSKWMTQIHTEKMKKSSFATAFVLGGVAALLAGACVAPVVIAVLLLAGKLFSQGMILALLLPFLLGIGMALPWPLAGAGLSFLPKPGHWMVRIKQAFGVIILLFGLWYGRLGWQLLQARSDGDRTVVVEAVTEQPESAWTPSLAQGLADAYHKGQPVFIDFWATWCKNCLQMDRTTFQDPAVLERLQAYVKIKFQAENMQAPDVQPVLDYFNVMGLPTYVILFPKDSDAQAASNE